VNKTPRIRIGNQSAFSSATVIEPFEFAVAHGFDAFEWFPDKKESGQGWEEKDIDVETRRYIRDTALEHDIRLSVHAPWHLNPLLPNAQKRILESLAFAEDVGASLLNIHLYMDQGMDAYVEGITPLITPLAQAGIRLSIENTPLTDPDAVNGFFSRLRALEPFSVANVGMCLDLGHANLCEATRNDYLRFIDLLEPGVRIIHVHLHENYGDADTHLPLFSGPSGQGPSGIRGFVSRMKKRCFSGCMILEVWPDPPGLLTEARDRLRKMLGNSQGPPVRPNKALNGFVDTLAEADRRCRSWREKLGWIHALLTHDGPDLSVDQLAYIAICLRFIGTGQVPCTEDGRHYRPSRHAKLSRDIYISLTRMTTPENVLVVRRIYPWLPSFGNGFTRAEPLTRIRDIAHRKDIPKELKEEIKHTLQNKLHRCAGPEDLATSSALLEKITAPHAHYSHPFVEAFKTFHEQLKAFFNARSLDERLMAMADKANSQAVNADRPGPVSSTHRTIYPLRLIDEFLQAKNTATTPEQLVTTLELLTTLRARFHEKLPGDTSAEGQERQLADIALEDFSFVLLSRLMNHLDGAKEEISWSLALRSLGLAVKNLRLSHLDPCESQAIESELALWRQGFESGSRDHLMRLKATLDRARRLTEFYCHKILSWFCEKADSLGRALGVAEEARRVFAEAEIRNHLVFQISKGLDLLLNWIRKRAALPLWDIIVPGKVSGRLLEAPGLDDLTGPFDEPIVALVAKAEAHEDIPAAVAGIISAHEIPHLSHLAIRARQRNIVLVACEDGHRYAELKNALGRHIILDVSEEKVSVGFASGPAEERMRERAGEILGKPVQIPEVLLSSGAKVPSLLFLGQVEPATGGSKAFTARRLEEISKMKTAGFSTPQGLVIPFGVMEGSLQAAPALEQAYLAVLNRLDELPQSDFSESLRVLREVVGRLDVPHEVVSGVMARFSPNERLMTRSSANLEDLKGWSAAGLYESMANIQPSRVAQGVRKVWSSLWTQRAAANRRRLGISHDRGHMAVLIQEMLVPEFSFVMHTINPINHDPNEVYVELAVGLGETLASGKIPGGPYRIVCHKLKGEVRVMAFASFSQAIWPDPAGALIRKTVHYSTVTLSTDEGFRNRLGRRLGTIGRFVEEALGGPQDIEGLVVGEKIYLVQARPQHAA
jgi:phosphoglucan,water dikinase